MAKAKQEKKEESTSEWIERINKKDGKRNGLKRRVGRHHR